MPGAAPDREWVSSTQVQLTRAEFIGSEAYDRHVRSMRLRYRRRRDELVAALAERAPDVRVTGIAAGLHAVLARDRDALVVGYARPSDSAWAGALDALCRVLP